MPELSNEEFILKVERKKELARLRAKKHYDKNKENILKKQKIYHDNIREKYKTFLSETQSQPIIPTQSIIPTQPIVQPQPITEPQPTIQPQPIVQPKPTKASKNGKDILDLNKTIELLNELNYNSENTKKTHIQNIKNVFYVTECIDLLKC